MRRALTSVIVPCWNALALTRVCLTRLARHTRGDCELVVVDNGSTDGTPEWLEAFARRPGALSAVRVLRNRRNLGYPRAMNQGLAAARGERVVFGNADAAVSPGWLEGLLEAFDARPDVGGVSPCSNPPRPQPPPGPWSAEPWYDGLKGLERFTSAAALAPAPAFLPADGFVPGFWFLTSRATLERVGNFDERFSPGGFEDWDLQWRMRRAGLALGFAGRVYVHHAWSGVSRLNGVDPARAYGPARLARFHRKNPDAVGARMEARTFFAMMAP